jgi:hypothetical protein
MPGETFSGNNGPEEQIVTTNQTPEKKLSFFSKFFHRQPADAITEEDRRLSESNDEVLTTNWQERLQGLRDDPEGLVHFMRLSNGQQFQELRNQENRGEKLSRFQQIIKGDLNFEATKDGQIRHNFWNELLYRGAKIMGDRQTLISGGLMAVVGVVSGIGVPGAAGFLARLAGRTAGELSGAKYENSLSKELLGETMFDWKDLVCKANEYTLRKDELTPEEKGQMLTEIIEAYYSKSQNVVNTEAQLSEHRGIIDERREKFGNWGGALGATGGLVTGLSGLTNLIDFAHFHGPAVTHAVRLVDGSWQFAQTAAEQAVVNFNTQTQAFGQVFHAMGGAFDGLKMFGTVAGGLGALFGGLKLGKMADKNALKEQEMIARHSAERLALQKSQMFEGAAQIGRPVDTSAGDESATTEAFGGSQEELDAVPLEYVEMAQEKGKKLPEKGQIWVYQDVDQDTGATALVYLKINSVDWEDGQVDLDIVDGKNNNITLDSNRDLSISDLLDIASEKGQTMDRWRKFASAGSSINIPLGQSILNRLNPHNQQPLEPGEYQLNVSVDDDQVVLTKDRVRFAVDIFDLALSDVQILEAAKTKEKAVELVVDHKYTIPKSINPPDELKHLPNSVIVRKSNDVIFLEDEATHDPILLPENLIEVFRKNYLDMGPPKGANQPNNKKNTK